MKPMVYLPLLLSAALVACNPENTEQQNQSDQSNTQQSQAAIDYSALSPEDVLSKMLSSQMKENNPGASYDLLSSSDKQVRSLEEYTRDNDIGAWKAYQDQYHYEIKSVEITDTTATAQVSFTVPDMEVIMNEALGQEKMMEIMSVMQSASEDSEEMSMKKADEMIVEAVSAHYQGGKTLPLTTEEQVYNLVKEASGWKVHHGWQDLVDNAQGESSDAPIAPTSPDSAQ